MQETNFQNREQMMEIKLEMDSKNMIQKSKKITKPKKGKQEKAPKVGSYIDKIKEIMGGDMESMDLSDEVLQDKKNTISNNGNSTILDAEEKQEKSRQSARDTRKRRKIYMGLLEKKVVSLSEELEICKNKCMILENKAQAHQNSDIMNKVQNERKQLFDKLEAGIKKGDDLEIDCIIDSLRLRLGIAGKTRLQALQSIFQEAVIMMMPFHMKYLFWISSNSLDIFKDDLETDSVDSANWFSNIGLSEKMIKDIQRDVLKQKEDYDQILYNLNSLRQQMIHQNEKSQNFIDELRNIFPTINTAKFLLDLDRKRGHYVHEKIYPESFWQEIVSKDIQQQQQQQQQNQSPLLRGQSSSFINEDENIQKQRSNSGEQIDESTNITNTNKIHSLNKQNSQVFQRNQNFQNHQFNIKQEIERQNSSNSLNKLTHMQMQNNPNILNNSMNFDYNHQQEQQQRQYKQHQNHQDQQHQQQQDQRQQQQQNQNNQVFYSNDISNDQQQQQNLGMQQTNSITNNNSSNNNNNNNGNSGQGGDLFLTSRNSFDYSNMGAGDQWYKYD